MTINPKTSFSQDDSIELSRWVKVLCEPNRLMLLEKIIDGVQCNCELGDSLSMAPNLVSHHLNVLKDAGIIDAERNPNDARWIYYSINMETFAKLKGLFDTFFEVQRIQPRRIHCGPSTEKPQSIF